MKVWDRTRIELATPGSAVRHASVAPQIGKIKVLDGNIVEFAVPRHFVKIIANLQIVSF